MEIIIGSTSNNIEGSRVLSSKQRRGLLPVVLTLTAKERSNNNWDLKAQWFPQKNKREPLIGYSIEYISLGQRNNPWVPLGDTTDLSRAILDVPPDAYKARVRANYLNFSSNWVESQSINLFINLSLDLTNSFHTLMV